MPNGILTRNGIKSEIKIDNALMEIKNPKLPPQYKPSQNLNLALKSREIKKKITLFYHFF